MADCIPDKTLRVIQNPKTNVQEGSRGSAESGSAAVIKVRPADLALIRSLSKSDSDLLASPVREEDGGLANRSGSVANCSSGQPSIERMPSFASEWDEVIHKLLGQAGGCRYLKEWHTGLCVNEKKGESDKRGQEGLVGGKNRQFLAAHLRKEKGRKKSRRAEAAV